LIGREVFIIGIYISADWASLSATTQQDGQSFLKNVYCLPACHVIQKPKKHCVLANFITLYPANCQSDFSLSVAGFSRVSQSSGVVSDEV